MVKRTHISHFTFHISHFTFHFSHFTFHISHFTSHISHFTFHKSHFTNHISLFSIISIFFVYLQHDSLSFHITQSIVIGAVDDFRRSSSLPLGIAFAANNGRQCVHFGTDAGEYSLVAGPRIGGPDCERKRGVGGSTAVVPKPQR